MFLPYVCMYKCWRLGHNYVVTLNAAIKVCWQGSYLGFGCQGTLAAMEIRYNNLFDYDIEIIQFLILLIFNVFLQVVF